ncbi:hypothetical protein [Geodermatophilus sp. SYSU D00684]
MSLTCTCFLVRDDEAAGTAARPGGPGDPFLTVDLPGPEPVVVLATPEELLTDRPADDAVLDAAAAEVGRGSAGAVFRVSAPLTRALADAPEARLHQVAPQWARTEELAGSDPEDLVDGLRLLAGLAREAGARGAGVHCRLEA